MTRMKDLPFPAFTDATSRTLADRFDDFVNVLDYGALGDETQDDTLFIQDAIFDAASRKIQCIYLPGGRSYKITKQGLFAGLFLDKENNMKSSAATAWDSGTTYASGNTVSYGGVRFTSSQNSNTGHTPTFAIDDAWWRHYVPDFAFSLALIGDDGAANGERYGTTLVANTNDFILCLSAPGQGMAVRGINFRGPSNVNSSYRGGRPALSMGLGVAGNGAGTRTLVERCSFVNFRDGFRTTANGRDQLGDANTVRDCQFSECYRPVYFPGTQNFINSVEDCVASNCTYGVVATNNGGCKVRGGNISTTSAAGAKFAVTSVSADDAGAVFTVEATVSSPDVLLEAGGIYNAFAVVTDNWGVVPLSLVSYNAGTNVGNWSVPGIFATYPARNTAGAGLTTDLGAITEIWAAERVTAFDGHGLDVDYVHIESPNVAFCMVNGNPVFGNRRNSIKNIYLNWDPSLADVMGGSPTDVVKAAFYCQQEWPFIATGGVETTVSLNNTPGVSDSLLVEINNAAPNHFKMEGPHTVPVALRTYVGNDSNQTLTSNFKDVNTLGFGGGYWEKTPFIPLQTMNAETTYRLTGWQATPMIGFRPVPYLTPVLGSSQITTLTDTLPAITFDTYYHVDYPLLWGGQTYRRYDGLPQAADTWTLRSNHIGYTYGQDIDDTIVADLSWTGQTGCHTVYINDTGLMFPGLVIGLTDNAVTEYCIVREVRKTMGYVRVEQIEQDGTPYFPQWGGAGAVSGDTLGQQPYAITFDGGATGLVDQITVIFGDGVNAIGAGAQLDVPVSFGCTITQAEAECDQSGSIVVDVWKDTYANYPPTNADSITASAPVTVSSATKSKDSTLTGWTTSVAAGSTLRFNVDSADTVTRATITLKVSRT